MNIVQRIKITFVESPTIFTPGVMALWSAFRLSLHSLGIFIGTGRVSFLDIPIMTGSPISVPYNLAATILLVTLIGIVTAIIGIFRKEKYRAWSVATIAAHLLCFHWVATVTEWAFNPPPGVDY